MAKLFNERDRWERLQGVFWVLLGLLLGYGSWIMDRLESQHINPWTAPGLVPGLLGVMMMVFGAGQFLRGAPRPRTDDILHPPGAANVDAEDGGAAQPEDPAAIREGWKRALIGLALCLIFGLGLVGRLPFGVAAAIFIFCFIAVFQQAEWRQRGKVLRGLIVTAIIAVVAGFGIAFVFQELFLIRLP